jgi:hypothetical protein
MLSTHVRARIAVLNLQFELTAIGVPTLVAHHVALPPLLYSVFGTLNDHAFRFLYCLSVRQ